MEDADKEPVLLVPPSLTKSSYATLVENGYVARTWHPEGRYGSRTHKVEVEVNENIEQNKESGTSATQIQTKRIKIGLPLLKSDEKIKFLKKCLQERDENNSNNTHNGMKEPLSSLVRLMSTSGVELIFKKPIISNRIPKEENFDATTHPEKMEKDFPVKLRKFAQHMKNSDGATSASKTISKVSKQRADPCIITHATPSKPHFKFCELFAGIGGFGVALEKLGGTCVFASEIYEPSKDVFRSNLGISGCPQEKIWGDIWDIDEKDIPSHDILVGGFPCQPFSTLGDQPGLEDTKTVSGRRCGDDNTLAASSERVDFQRKAEVEGGSSDNDDSTDTGNGRGQLFTQIVRVLRHCQPKAFLLENVQGLVTTANGEALKIIESSLRNVGYDVCSEVISSRGLTVQARKRLYIVGIRSSAKNMNDGIDHQDQSNSSPFQFPFIPDLGLRASEVLHTNEELQHSFAATGIPQTLIDLLKQRKDANTRLPASYFQISDAQMDQLRHRSKVWKPAKLAWSDKTCDVIDSHYGISVGKGNSQLVPSPAPFNPRRFTPRECARVMGFSNSFSLGEFDERRFTSRSGEDAQFNGYIKEQYYMLGNAVCPPVISVLAGAILDQVMTYEFNISDTGMETHTWLERGLWSGIQLSFDSVNPQKLSEVCDRLDSQFSS